MLIRRFIWKPSAHIVPKAPGMSISIIRPVQVLSCSGSRDNVIKKINEKTEEDLKKGFCWNDGNGTDKGRHKQENSCLVGDRESGKQSVRICSKYYVNLII